MTVTDDQLAIATQNVTITITGANDAPLIVAGDVTGNITEGTTLTDNGSMTFTDVDLTDRPVATEATATVTALQQDGVTPLVLSAAQQLAIENAFTITNVAGNTNDGTVTWDYTILETALDFLGEGEQVTAVFTVTVTDDQLAIATQNVTITITGANDAPLIVAGDVTGNITEGTTLTDNGSMTFTDVDLTDRPVATEATATVTALQQDGVTPLVLSAAQQLAIENAFTITNVAGNTNDGTVTWDYTILETALDFLGEGEQVTAVFTVTVTDDQLAIATQNVTITITGANDAPLIVAGDVTGNITEGTTLTDNGSMTFTDVDLTDRPVATEATATVHRIATGWCHATGAERGAAVGHRECLHHHQRGRATPMTARSPGITPSSRPRSTSSVKANRSPRSFTVTVTDDQLAIATQNVTITITGANDAPLIVAGDVTGNITEGTTLTDNGSMTFTDVDLTDRPVATEATATVTALQQDGVTPLVLSAAQQLAIENAFTITDGRRATPMTARSPGITPSLETDARLPRRRRDRSPSVFTVTVDRRSTAAIGHPGRHHHHITGSQRRAAHYVAGRCRRARSPRARTLTDSRVDHLHRPRP